jgi:hypothetical protein
MPLTDVRTYGRCDHWSVTVKDAARGGRVECISTAPIR